MALLQFDFYKYIEELHDIYDLYTVDKEALPNPVMQNTGVVQVDAVAKHVWNPTSAVPVALRV